MRSFDVGRFTVGISAAIAVLAGCGGSQPPIGAPIAMAQSRAIAQHAQHGGSWMLPEAKRRDLLYLASPYRVTVYTFPAAHKVGELSIPSELLYGECTDAVGDVFVVDANYGAYEYPHGGTTMASIQNPLPNSHGCSIDPVTGNLAIASAGGKKVLSIYRYNPKRGWRFAKTYADATMKYAYYCTYDSSGNLYIDGTPRSQSGFVLAEQPRGASKLRDITLNQSLGGPGQVQWDGSYLAIGDITVSPSVVYRFSISGSTATEVGSLELVGSDQVLQFWIQNGLLVGPDNHNNDAGFWSYPSGGYETKKIKLPYAFGSVVSLANSLAPSR